MHGQFVWYDLMTSDAAAAQRHYPPITGWKTQKFDKASPDMPYTMWTVNGEPIGGVVQLTSEQRARGVPPHWLPSVQVNDVDETARQAASLGGKAIYGPTDIPDTGHYAIIQDPQGASLAIYRPSMPGWAFDGTPQAGRVSWNELMTTDYKAAFEFYRKLFGWERTDEMDMGPDGVYFMYGKQGKRYGGMYNRPPQMAQVPPFWLPYTFVKDLKKATEAATKNGFSVVNGPMDVPGGRVVVLKDPQGAAFAMHEAAAKAPASAAASAKVSKPKARQKTKAKPKVKARAKAKPKKKVAARARPRGTAKARSRAKAKARKRARR